MKLGEIIRVFRKNNKMTMQEFADKAGLSKGYISMLEKNQHPQSQRKLVPSFETYQKVANAMSMSIDELVALLDDNETVRLNETSSSSSSDATDSAPAPLQLSAREEHLVVTFRGLNEDGQEKAVSYVDDLAGMAKYQMTNWEEQMWKDADEIAREEYENAARLTKRAK